MEIFNSLLYQDLHDISKEELVMKARTAIGRDGLNGYQFLKKSEEFVEFECGKFFIPETPPLYEIDGYDLPQDEQYFRRIEFPSWYRAVMLDEIDALISGKDFLDARMESFKEKMWYKRLFGHWFMNNGVPTYITGRYFFYLHCKFDHRENDGYPIYYDEDRLEFYFSEYCFCDKSCIGYLKIGSRGTGKSSKEVAILMEAATRKPRRQWFAIQSKDQDTAKDIYNKKIVPMFKSLPYFWQPIVESSNSVTEMKFIKPTRRGKNTLGYIHKDGEDLENNIKPFNSTVKALDSQQFGVIFNDEVGKTTTVDVYERHETNRYCVIRNGRKIGMILCTTTVEEMEGGGGKQCYRMWRNSDPKKKSKNGNTITGLYRYFVPTSRTTRNITIDGESFSTVDKFGFVDIEVSKQYHRNTREALRHDNKAYASECRKNPETIDEAFYIENNDCEFNALVLNERLSYLNQFGEDVRIGNLEWVGTSKTEVRFAEREDGKFKFASLPPMERRNKVRTNMFGKIEPMNTHLYCIGTDPVEHGVILDDRKSNAACYVFEKYDIAKDDINSLDEHERPMYSHGENGRMIDSWVTHNFITEYVNRPEDPNIYFEDMAKLCVFFGCQILCESQKNSIVNYFNNNGFGLFLMNRPKETFVSSTTTIAQQQQVGLASTSPVIQQYTGKLATFVDKHGHRIKFKALLTSLLMFRASKPRDFDETVAAGFTLLANSVVEVEKAPIYEKGVSFHRTYKKIGNNQYKKNP